MKDQATSSEKVVYEFPSSETISISRANRRIYITTQHDNGTEESTELNPRDIPLICRALQEFANEINQESFGALIADAGGVE